MFEHLRRRNLVDWRHNFELEQCLPRLGHHGTVELELARFVRRELVKLVKGHLKVERLTLVDLLQCFIDILRDRHTAIIFRQTLCRKDDRTDKSMFY